MNEVEIKFRIDNIEQLKENLKYNKCIFSEQLKQKDIIFLPNINDTDSGEGKIFVRIREVNGIVEINLKKQSNIGFMSKEIEFEVNDFFKAQDFLETLGLTEWVTVEKKRVTTKYNGFNICIDEVKKLGSFVEIEIITEEDNILQYEEKIINVATKLGIDTNNRINDYYDSMIDKLNRSGE